jgi:hypothetical protein
MLMLHPRGSSQQQRLQSRNRNGRHVPPPPRMLKIYCETPQHLDQAWRMLAQVPDDEFQPAEIWRDGQHQYTVVRTADGEQTTARLVDQLVCSPCP